MKFQKIFLYTFLGLFAFSSCQQSLNLSDNALGQIPATTSSLTTINIKQLMEKADFQEVVKMEFYQEIVAKATKQSPSIAAVLNDPYKSGVDLESNAYFIQDLDMSGKMPFNALVVNIKDKTTFEALVKTDNGNVRSGEGFNYLQPERGSIIAWNDAVAVMGAGSNDLKGKAESIFSTEGSNSIANNKDLQKCLARNADISSWFSSDVIAEEAGQQMGMQMAMAGFSKEMLAGNYAHSYFDFENGKIDATSTYTINPELAKEFGIIFKDEVETDFSKYIPNQNLAFAVTGALSMDGINKAITKRGMNALVNGQMREFGLTTDDIAKAFDGDFVVAGFHSPNSKDPVVMIGTKINDRTTFNKFLDLGLEFELMTKVSEGVYNMKDARMKNGPSQLIVQDDMIFIGSDNNMLAQIKEGGFSKADRISGKANEALQHNILGGYLNFQQLGKFDDNDEVDVSELEDAMFRFDSDDGTFKLELKDKDVNSLKKIFQWLNDNYKKENMM